MSHVDVVLDISVPRRQKHPSSYFLSKFVDVSVQQRR